MSTCSDRVSAFVPFAAVVSARIGGDGGGGSPRCTADVGEPISASSSSVLCSDGDSG